MRISNQHWGKGKGFSDVGTAAISVFGINKPGEPVIQKKNAEGNETNTTIKPQLSHNFGNTRLQVPIQPKLTINTPGDLFEQEADAMAEKVMRTTGANSNDSFSTNKIPATIQKKCAACEKEEKERPKDIQRKCTECDEEETQLQRKESRSKVSSPSNTVKQTLQSSGEPLNKGARSFMESRLGFDFSRVKIYNNSLAHQSAKDINALAYTHRNNIVFGAGQYQPETESGKKLLAHELTHVVQQSGSDELDTNQRKERSNLPSISPISANSKPFVQRQVNDGNEVQQAPDMMRAYSFGPTGAGRVVMNSGTTIFSPAAPVDAKGNELVRAGTPAQPILSRFGRYFTLDERHRPYPPPVPSCNVKAITEWHPDDGSASSKDVTESTTDYYGPGEPLGTKLGSEYIFSNDRPGVLNIGYVFNVPGLPFILVAHGVHFVNDPNVPQGATVLPNPVTAKGSALAAPPEAKAPTQGAGKTTDSVSGKKPESTGGISIPSSPSAQNNPAPFGEIQQLTELIKKTSDAASKDALVRKLRDFLSRVQPVIPTSDAQKAIDDAIKSLVRDGTDAGIMALLKALTGKSPSSMPENRNQTGPNVPQKDLGEHVFQGPKISIKDAPPLPSRTSFQYKNGLRQTYESGTIIKFTLLPPDNFDPSAPYKYLVIVSEADRNVVRPEKDWFAKIRIDSAAPKQIELPAPTEPGKYVFRVDIGISGPDYSSVQEFEVTAPGKKD